MMRPPVCSRSVACVFFAAFLWLITPSVFAEQQSPSFPDKDLCIKMFRSGLQSFERKRYTEAKGYFRKAIQADPNFMVAWRFYDKATLFALAEEVEKDAGLIAPDTSIRAQQGSGRTVPPAPLPPQTGPARKSKFVIVEDEGC
ncbi:MAG: hypothetical protein B1H11_11575 [Desulfobacteraceae bacterium 4484_190.1]|nr:MAG: hypothetical protein B1H11_11575 [Desulfobacteraceae bacterium 4484_190.1]